MLEQRKWAAELDRGRGWLEDQRQQWQAQAEDRERAVQEQQAWIGELEGGKAWLEEQRGNWEKIARQREEQVAHWQAQTRHWQESVWGRLGTRLKIVKPGQEFSAKVEPAKVKRDD